MLPKKLIQTLKIVAGMATFMYPSVGMSQRTQQFNISAEALGSLSTMQFSIAGNLQGNSPNILSELSWNTLHYTGGGIKAGYHFLKKWDAYFGFNFSKAIKGEVSDFDYADDNRTRVVNQLYHSSHGSELLTINTGVAYIFFDNRSWLLKTGAAYTLQKQRLNLLNYPGSNSYTDVSYAEGLQSVYATQWDQYGVSASATFRKMKHADVQAGTTLSYCNYQAYGNWNLKKEYIHPKSYEHTGNGFSVQNRLMVFFNTTKQIQPYLVYGFDFLKMKNGIDKLNYQSGSVAYTKLNEAFSVNHSFAAGIRLYWGNKTSEKHTTLKK